MKWNDRSISRTIIVKFGCSRCKPWVSLPAREGDMFRFPFTLFLAANSEMIHLTYSRVPEATCRASTPPASDSHCPPQLAARLRQEGNASGKGDNQPLEQGALV